MPLRLTVLAQGSTSPALQVGFTDLTFGPQDPARFTFTPPAGATVKDAPSRDAQQQQRDKPTVVGDGWDRVIVEKVPQNNPDRAKQLAGLGTPDQRLVGQRTADQDRGRRPPSSPTTAASRRAPFPSRCCPRHCRR